MAGEIQFRQFQVWYGAQQAIFPMDLDIPAGQITAFLGPSGCGKSTCLRGINRMNDTLPGCRMAGEIFVDGENILSPKTDVLSLRRQVGMVFQRPNPFPKSIFENVVYGVRLQGERRRSRLLDIAAQQLTAVGLWEEVGHRLKQSALGLSGGQQQRLCIARALAVQPKILLLDEPTAALDPVATGTIEGLLLRLREQYTLVLVTHNLLQAKRTADRIAFFSQGHLVETGASAQLFADPKAPETRQYLLGG